MKLCQKCGAELAEDAKFCKICGEMCNASTASQDSRKENGTEQNEENASTVSIEENSQLSKQVNENKIPESKRKKKLSKKSAIIILTLSKKKRLRFPLRLLTKR